MPLVRISILKGKSPDYIRAISESIHQSLVEAYNVPAGDRFQLIHQHDREEFVYDADYLGVHRSGDMVFIHATAGKWRDTATKKALFKRLAERLAESPGLRPEDVQVIISSNDREDWSFGKGLASYLPRGGLTSLNVVTMRHDALRRRHPCADRGGVYSLSSHFRDTGSASSANEREAEGDYACKRGRNPRKELMPSCYARNLGACCGPRDGCRRPTAARGTR